jgi:REP element-mobilizing transposase RayT
MPHLAGHYYHVYNRTISGRPLFLTDHNYVFLLQRIKQYLPTYQLSFITYCLMPTHYHFLLRPEADDQLSPFIQRLFNSYTQALNKQTKHTGTLFEKNVQYRLVESTEYLLELSKYIHLNPVQAGLVNDPGEWLFSNYLEWVGRRNGTLVDRDLVHGFFQTPELYEAFVKQESSAETVARLANLTFEP